MIDYLFVALILLTLVIWFWAFIDIQKSRFINNRKKWFWIVSIICLPIIAPIIYFQIGKRHKRKPRKFQPEFN